MATFEVCRQGPAEMHRTLISALPFPGGFDSRITYRLKESSVPEAVNHGAPEVMHGRSPVMAVQEEPPVQEESPSPRTYFPETWLWDLVPVG